MKQQSDASEMLDTSTPAFNGKPSGLPVGSLVKLSDTTGGPFDGRYDVPSDYLERRITQPSPAYWQALSPPLNRMVRLKLSEIETLRLAVSGSDEARAVLNKLAHLIEVEVDF